MKVKFTRLESVKGYAEVMNEAARIAGYKPDWVYHHDIRESANCPIRVCIKCGTIHDNWNSDRLPGGVTQFISKCGHDENLDKPQAWHVDSRGEVFVVAFERCILCQTWNSRRKGRDCPSCGKAMGLIYEGIGYNGEQEFGVLVCKRGAVPVQTEGQRPSPAQEPEIDTHGPRLNTLLSRLQSNGLSALSSAIDTDAIANIPKTDLSKYSATLQQIKAVSDRIEAELKARLCGTASIGGTPPEILMGRLGSLKSAVGHALENSGSSTKAECFVATACYGSVDHPAVLDLRVFRDERLLPHFLGRAFVAAYYTISPPIANFLVRHPILAQLVRRLVVSPLHSLFCRNNRMR